MASFTSKVVIFNEFQDIKNLAWNSTSMSTKCVTTLSEHIKIIKIKVISESFSPKQFSSPTSTKHQKVNASQAKLNRKWCSQQVNLQRFLSHANQSECKISRSVSLHKRQFHGPNKDRNNNNNNNSSRNKPKWSWANADNKIILQRWLHDDIYKEIVYGGLGCIVVETVGIFW